MCDIIPLTFATASRCLHSLRSVDMTAFAAFATGFCQKNSVSLCKGTKAPEFGIRRILGQYAGSRFGMFFRLCNRRSGALARGFWQGRGFLDAKAGFGGFGSRRLISQGFLGAKAPLDPLCYASLFGTGNLFPNSA